MNAEKCYYGTRFVIKLIATGELIFDFIQTKNFEEEWNEKSQQKPNG